MKNYGDSQTRSGNRHSRNLTKDNDPESDEEGMLESGAIRKTTIHTFDYEETESIKGSEKRGAGGFDFELGKGMSRGR